MMPPLRHAVSLLALAVAFAAAAPARAAVDPQRYKQTDYKFPPSEREFGEDVERGFIQSILTHHKTAVMAQSSGNMDQARAEWASEARGLAEFCDKFPSTEYRVSFRYQAAKLFMYAQQPEVAAEQAEKIQVDPAATKASRAAAAYLAAVNWLTVGYGKAKAGALDRITLPTAEQRRDRPLAPRPPPGEWRRFVLAADAYAADIDADPDRAKPASERIAGVAASMLALQAAQVQYAFDNMEDARARFEKIIQTWPGEADVMEATVPLYLQTFGILKDEAGQAAALGKVKAQVAEPASKATDPKAKEGFAKVLDLLARHEGVAAFAAAQRLLDGGKPAEAAAAFEQLASTSKVQADAGLALFNAAVAWEKAGQVDKASALREQLVKDHTDPRIVPGAMLSLAGTRSKAGSHEAARALYQEYLQRFPDGSFRCGALQNLGIELEALKKPLDAAAQYLAFGADATCSTEDPNATARLLFRGAELFDKGGKKAQAKEAYAAVVKQGASVTDVVSKSLVIESKKRLKRP